MNLGTNDYDKKYIPAETVVSRTLQSKNRFWTNMIWRTGKPALDSEWNLLNDLAIEWLKEIVSSKTPSGWLNLGANRYLSGNSGTADNIEYFASDDESAIDIPNAIVNGWPLIVGGVNYTDTTLNSINLNAAGADGRTDFVFLEVWRAQVRSRDNNNNPISQNKPSTDKIYAYGNIDFGGTHIDDDLVDPVTNPPTSGIETSQRVQIQYRIRVVDEVTFSTNFSTGFDDSTVQGQGAATNPQATGYDFTNMVTTLGDPGLWRAGSGDEASRVALETVDGYTYAIPMFKITRRGNQTYSDTGATPTIAEANQKQNEKVLTDLVSDRPDGKFNDGIDATDILDIRYKVFLGEVNYNKIMEMNLNELFKGTLVSGKQAVLQYDSISDVDVNGYTDFSSNLGTSGTRKVWSDAETTETEIYAEVTTTTTNASLDAYRSSGTGAWSNGDTVQLQIIAKWPGSTIITGTPSVYVEDKDKTDVSGDITWTDLNTANPYFTIDDNTNFGSKDIWIYYDVKIPAGNGLSYAYNDFYSVRYIDYASYPTGNVIRGETFEGTTTRFQDLFDHTYENQDDNGMYRELIQAAYRKEISFSPMIQSTTTRDGGTRILSVTTIDAGPAGSKLLHVPFPIQHIKGIYSAQTGGTEVATLTQINVNVTSVDPSANSIVIDENNFTSELTSLKYDSTGAFSGSEIELLIAGGGSYGPVYTHTNVTGPTRGTYVKLYDANGDIYDISPSALPSHFKWSGRGIPIRNGAGDGYDINDTVIDCSGSDADLIGFFDALPDETELWVDMDYLSMAHQSAELRLVYSHVPYQGADVGNQDVKLVYKREKGIYHNNGTGGGVVEETTSGESNINYSPLSVKVPGSIDDYQKDGSIVELVSCGTLRFDTDIITNATYEVLGYYGGGTLWDSDVFTIPATPETTSRGFLGSPLLQVIFEDPTTDPTYSEFLLPLLVKDNSTKELYLFIQSGNKGIHKSQSGDLNFDIFRLSEKLLIL